jgi:hypothetical protein
VSGRRNSLSAANAALLAMPPAACYKYCMTKQALEILLERVASWSEDAQEELVQTIAEIEKKHLGVHRLSSEERAAVRRSLSEMREGKLASEEEVAALFARYRA